MKISDLDARFVRLGKSAPGGGRPIERVDTLGGAQALQFLCPRCAATPGAEAHRITIAFAGFGLLDSDGLGLLWQVSGTSLADLTLSPSILCGRGHPCSWHGFVRNGATVDA